MMTVTEINKVMEAKRVELRAILRDMRGINPRVSTYARLMLKASAIEREIERLGQMRKNRP